MHELSLTQEIIKLIEEQVSIHNVKKVHHVNVKIGQMMAVLPSSLTFCFEILSRGTILEGTKLEIEEVPIRCKCKACGGEFIVESFIFACPDCQGSDLEQVSGNEFMVHTMEVD